MTGRDNKISQRSAKLDGIEVSAFDSVRDCADALLAVARSGKGGFAAAMNPEKLMSCRVDAQARAALEQATIRYPDGAGIMLAMRSKGVPTVRVPGADLWLEVLRRAGAEGASVAVIGGQSAVLAAAVEQLGHEFPAIRVVLARDGFDGVSDPGLIGEELARVKPEFTFVAMGSPKQEALISLWRTYCQSSVYMGLGGSLDVYTGTKRRAPRIMRFIGAEWLYRLIAEPTRAGRQRRLIGFVGLLLSGRL
jgi:UDP-N-acetyl-D-mannosaminouronate:lipid I N-acetyl-D-mannosaminouronosyltransferase